jgi:cyclopropane fatty-acyl-phospholipid synthase-like methyltransferase
MNPPKTSADFDAAYRKPLTPWEDTRIPKEIKALVACNSPRRALEMGCGVGRLSQYVARQGVDTTGIDFSVAAISRAQARVAQETLKPRFVVGDVTRLDSLAGPFDVAFDVGCFHCLDINEQQQYASVVARLLAPGGILLIWAIDDSPSCSDLTPPAVEAVFAGRLQLL